MPGRSRPAVEVREPEAVPVALEVVQEERELAQVEDRLVRATASPSAPARPGCRARRRASASCRASYASTHSAPFLLDEEPRVRRPSPACEARRRPAADGLPTGAARRRARVATLIGISWPPGGEDSEGRRLDVPGAASIAPIVATDLETAKGLGTAAADHVAPQESGRDRRPLVALGLVAAAAFVLYTLLSLGADGPRVHPDEVRYLIAASSLVEGEGLTLRGQDYGFGPLLPLVLAAILRVAGSVDAAYDWFKAANALFFALTAIPVYLLARRLVSQWWAVVAAALAVAIPSSISVVTVMTESLSYLTTMWALYAIALALERPSILRQLAVLGTVAAAVLTRTQFGILYVTWVGALACLWLLAPATRPRSRADLVRFWPTALPVVLGALAFVARLASGSSAKDTFGAYWELWRGYDPFAVAKWFVYHLGDFAVYLVVVPVAVAPIVLWELGRAGRAGSRPAAAFVSLFAAANVSGLLVVAAFTSTPWGYDRLHDRYGFYLVPLWLVALVWWLASGLPRPRVAAAIGAVATLTLVLVLPFAQLANEAGIDTVPGALWLRIEAELAGPGPASGRLALALFVVGLARGDVLPSARASPASHCRPRSRSGSRRCRTSPGSA